MGEFLKAPRRPLGEGAARLSADEGRHQSRPLYRPTPVPGSARSTLSQERVSYPHKNIPEAAASGITRMYLTSYRLPHTLG